MGDALEQIERAHSKASAVSGIDTGFVDLDECTSGLQKGDLIVLAACPGVGKTALALNLARNAAVDAGGGVMIFSPKMSRMQLVRRLLSAETQVDLHKLRTGQLCLSPTKSRNLGHLQLQDPNALAELLRAECEAKPNHSRKMGF